MTVDRSRVGIGEVDGVVKKGVGAIGEDVHAIRANRRRKNQQTNNHETSKANETSHDHFPLARVAKHVVRRGHKTARRARGAILRKASGKGKLNFAVNRRSTIRRTMTLVL